jgi:hypothetical protein
LTPNSSTRAVLLGAEGNEETARYVEKSLESRGVEVHRATVEGLLAIVDPDHYTLIVPCSGAALNALAALPENDRRRIRALLPSNAALSTVQSIAGANITGGNHSSVLCLYVHGKLSLCFPDNSELVGSAKRVLDAVQWHGLARLSAERAPDGSLHLVAVSAGLDKTVLEAGVSLPQALWRVARGEPVGHS